MLKVLEKIHHAQTPERFTIDFLETKLGCRGGNYRQFISLAKKLDLLATDGRPTDTYKRFRNSATSGAAIAEALRTGYGEVFQRNEYAHNLNKDQFKGMVVEITGLASKSRVVQLICQTFETLRKVADFEAPTSNGNTGEGADIDSTASTEKPPTTQEDDLDLNLSYTINLVLPNTEDVAVFNSIFKALRAHLLRK